MGYQSLQNAVTTGILTGTHTPDLIVSEIPIEVTHS